MPSDASHGVTVKLDGARVAWWVLGIGLLVEVVFVLLDYHINYGRLIDIGAIRRMTNIAREDGLASWFGATQTLLAGLTAFTIFLIARAAGVSRWRQAGWAFVSLLFIYMAVDDGAQLHERFGTAVQTIGDERGATLVTGFPSYTWQLVFVPLFGAAGLATAVFLWRELSDRAALVLVAAALACFGLAVGLDFVEGLEADHPANAYTILTARTSVDAWAERRFERSGYETLDHFGRSLEEFLEMLGITFFWVTFIRALGSIVPEVRVRWATSPLDG